MQADLLLADVRIEAENHPLVLAGLEAGVLGEFPAPVRRPDELRHVGEVGVAPGLELQDQAVVPFAIVAGEQDVDPRSSRGGDVVLDGDLHVVVDARPPQGVREAGVFVGPHRPIRRHAPGLPLEALDQPTFEPIEIDVLQKSAPRLGVDDHGGSIPYPRPVQRRPPP
jgi:hypothetical protein